MYAILHRGDGEAATVHAFRTWTGLGRCLTSLNRDLRRRPLLSPASAFPQRRRCRPLVSHWSPTFSHRRNTRRVSFSISFLAILSPNYSSVVESSEELGNTVKIHVSRRKSQRSARSSRFFSLKLSYRFYFLFINPLLVTRMIKSIEDRLNIMLAFLVLRNIGRYGKECRSRVI